MKKLLLTICLLAGMVLVQGCSAGSALAMVALSANKLTPVGEEQLIITIETKFVEWHEEQHVID